MSRRGQSHNGAVYRRAVGGSGGAASWKDGGYASIIGGVSLLRRYIEPLLRRPLHVLVPAVMGLATGLGLALGVAPRYRSVVSLAVEWRPSPRALSPSMAAAMSRRRLPALRQGLVDAAGVERPGRAVEVRAVDANRIELECVDREPERAAAVANRLAALLVERAGVQRPEAPPAGPGELALRLAEARRALEANEEAIGRLKEDGAVNSVNPAAAEAVALQSLQAEHAAVTGQIAEAQGTLDRLRRSPPDAAVPPSDPELARLRQDLAALRARYTDHHPDVQAALDRLAEREAFVATAPPAPVTAAPDAQVREVEASLGPLSARQARLESEIAGLRVRVRGAGCRVPSTARGTRARSDVVAGRLCCSPAGASRPTT